MIPNWAKVKCLLKSQPALQTHSEENNGNDKPYDEQKTCCSSTGSSLVVAGRDKLSISSASVDCN